MYLPLTRLSPLSQMSQHTCPSASRCWQVSRKGCLECAVMLGAEKESGPSNPFMFQSPTDAHAVGWSEEDEE